MIEDPSVGDLLDEVAALTPEDLQEAVRAGGWPIHRLRARLDTGERLAAARAKLVDLDLEPTIAHATLRPPGAAAEEIAASIAVARLDALARAWSRLGGDEDDRLFHRGAATPPLRLTAWVREVGPRIAIDPNPGVPLAPTLPHPLTLEAAARFAIVLPILARAAALADAAARALDALGQPTTALQQVALQAGVAPHRRTIWRLAPRPSAPRSQLRIVTLAASQLLQDVDDDGPARFGLTTMRRHPSEWSQGDAVILGALAWRRACELDARVADHRRARWWHAIHLHPAVVGRRYRELADPFAPQVAIQRLGAALQSISRAATTLALWI